MKRPDGTTPLTLAWAFFVGSIVIAFIAYSMDVATYEGIDPNKIALQWTLWLLSGALFQLWLVLWAVGSILRGLWFLPGEEQKEPQANATSALSASPLLEGEGQMCGWCNRRVRKPGLACSEATKDQCRTAVATIPDPVCRTQLQQHGY
jgi:hypothetical protein